MAFSNDDLKRLKENEIYWKEHGRPWAVKNAQDILALIARLEAAEKVCDLHALRWPESKLYIAWRKAAGLK